MQSNPLLQKVSDIIQKSVPASRIVLLAYTNKEKQSFTEFSEPGFHLQDPAEMHLFILADVPNVDRNAAIDKIEQRCKAIIPVCVMLMNKKEFAALLRQGNRFAVTAMQSTQVIYQKDNNEAALPTGEDTTNHHPEYINWYRRGMVFREMAHAQFKAGEYEATAFCIHMSAEQFLCMLMQMRIGYRISTHNLDRQLHLLQFYVPEIRTVFCRETQPDKQKLQSIRNCFIGFMNKTECTIGEAEVDDYLDELYRLQMIAEGVFYTQSPLLKHLYQAS